jgi:hypothetical protein
MKFSLNDKKNFLKVNLSNKVTLDIQVVDQ